MTLTTSRRTDLITSVEAGSRAKKLASQDYVRHVMRTSGPYADHELVAFYEDDIMAWRFGRFSPQRLRTARHELTEAGEIEATGYFHLTPSNFRAHVWQTKEQDA